MPFRVRASLISAVVVALSVAGLVGTTAAAPVASAAVTPTYYVALGDSLAANAGANPSSNSYVNRTYADEAARMSGLQLANLSCGGATTASMLTGSNCGKSVTQIVDAENFLRAHRGNVAFVTIDIGGNDASGCIGSGGVNTACVASSAAAIQTNLTTILSRLKAAYPGIKVFGMSYYTPQLAFWLTGASGQQVATDAVPYAHTFNAQLTQIYATAGFKTADVATAFDNDNLALTGTYLGQTVPQNVANLCNWTLQCSNNDVHANNTGHGKIADQFTKLIDQLPGRAPLAIPTANSLPAAKLGVAYSTKIVATGGTAPYRFKKLNPLPKGLKLVAKTGVISGTPKVKTTGVFVKIQVTDKAKPKAVVAKTFLVKVT